MATKGATDREKSTRAVVSAAETHAEEIAKVRDRDGTAEPTANLSSSQSPLLDAPDRGRCSCAPRAREGGTRRSRMLLVAALATLSIGAKDCTPVPGSTPTPTTELWMYCYTDPP